MNSTLEASINSTAMSDSFLGVSRVDMWAYAVNFLFGVSTHSYIIWLIVRGTGNGVASEFFNIHLSVCGLCFSFNSLLIMLSNVSNLSFNYLQTFLLGITITGNPVFQSLICVERYLAVVHPVTFLKYKPLRYRVICCTAGWMITLGSCVCCIFTIASYYLKAFIFSFSIQLLLFFSIQLFCLVAVHRALKQLGPGERREREEENNMKRRAFHLILIITVSMLVTFVPLIFAGLLSAFTQLNSQPFISFGLVCFIFGGFVHPFLFLQRTGKISCICSS